MKAKYINPFTDFGFKKIFGEEASKPLLLDFLNSLLPENDKIAKLSFKNNEQIGRSEYDRKAVYNIYCENQKGEKFIVELQKAKQNYFIERTIYYSTFPIQEQAEKGFWNYNLKAVYCIGILDFTFDDYENEPEKSEVIHTIKLKNQNGKTFYDKLTYIYLEMPNFKMEESELSTRIEQWLYFIKHLEDFQSIPKIFKDKIFIKAFQKAEIAKYNDAEFNNYQNSLKIFRDNKAVFDYAMETATSLAREAGLEEGREIGKLIGELEGEIKGKIKGEIKGELKGELKANKLTAKKLKDKGFDVETIIEITGLTRDEIEKL